MNIDIVQAATLLIAALALFISILSYRVNREMAKAASKSANTAYLAIEEMRVTRELDNAPSVYAYFEKNFNQGFINLVIGNNGKGIAKNIKFIFTPQLQHFAGMEIKTLIERGVSIMPPNHRIALNFCPIDSLFENPDAILEYKIKVTFYGGLTNEEITNEDTLDLSLLV